MNHLQDLNSKITKNKDKLDLWIKDQINKVFIPLYTSVDLRISEHKIVPVDTNVFPAGFNNLSDTFRNRASSLFKDYFDREYPKMNSILIIPELHTRNTFYWENISVLKSILENVGYRVEVGIISDDDLPEEMEFEAASGNKVKAYRALKDNNRVTIPNLNPDLLLINNDFSEQCPKTLRDITQPVEPPVEIGWHTRKKSIHFEFYNKLAQEVAQILEIDPWVISIDTIDDYGVDFDSREDREKIAQVADSMINRLKIQYKERGISEEPYLFIKSNSGTYGMAVVNVSSGDDVRALNSDKRKRMRVRKGGSPVRDVVLQEGIPTSLKYESDISAEPVFYLIDAQVAGGFLRLNKSRNTLENLNSRGMEFAHIDPCDEATHLEEVETLCSPALELVSRIATIAAGYEIEKILDEGGCVEEVA
ncbi:MAG: glutamate--cysteine ligase [Thermodesulfobacteriales bacterium]|nr:MAG: glutamate--cysteine ligase [Thermodesulfobacteriales bacterium]